MEHPLKFISENTNRLINAVACAGLLAITLSHQQSAVTPAAKVELAKSNIEKHAAGFTPSTLLDYLSTTKLLAPGEAESKKQDPFGFVHIHEGDALLDDSLLSDPKSVPLAYPLPVTMRADSMSDMFSRMSDAWENTVIDMTHPASHTDGPTRVQLVDAQSKVFVYVNEKIERSPAAKKLSESARSMLSYAVATRLHTQVMPKDLDKVASVIDADGSQYIESYIHGRDMRIATLGIKGDTLEELDYLAGTADLIATSVTNKLERQHDIQLTQM